MDDTENQGHWHDLYRRAMQEPDPALLELRIREAQESVQKRARQLWYGKTVASKEREALTSAAHLLEVLRSCLASRRSAARQHRAA